MDDFGISHNILITNLMEREPLGEPIKDVMNLWKTSTEEEEKQEVLT